MPESVFIRNVGSFRTPAGAFPRRFPHVDGHASFEIYRTERVSLTSILFSGDDWRWRFRSAAGAVLVNSEGYSTERACRAAVTALQHDASSAQIAVPARV